MSNEEKDKGGDEGAQEVIRKIRYKVGYRGEDVEPLSTRKKKKKKVVKANEAIDPLTLLKGGLTAYRAYKHPLTQDLIGAIKKKFRKKKKKESGEEPSLEEGSRSIKRFGRRVAAGHVSIDSPSLQHKMDDIDSRQRARKAGSDPDERQKKLQGAMGGLQTGQQDLARSPQSVKNMSPLDMLIAASDRPQRVVKSSNRAFSRSMGTFRAGRDQPGVVGILAKQRKEAPDKKRDTEISNRVRVYRTARRARNTDPSLN